MSDFGDYIIVVNIILVKIEQKDAKERVKYAVLFVFILDNKYPDEFMDKIYNNRILIEK